MKSIGLFIGRMVFWATFPALWIILHGTKRTRVLIIYNDEYLVLKGWLNNGKWNLPGGGLHKKEESIKGLIREVTEETGLLLKARNVTFFYAQTTYENYIKFRYDCYWVVVGKKPEIIIQKYEIAEYKWLKFVDTDYNLSIDTKQAVSKWLNK